MVNVLKDQAMKFKVLLAALALAGLGAFAGPSIASYANLQPPAGWGGSSSSGYTWSRTAANAPWSGGSAAAQVTAQVQGRSVTMSASMRLAANAGRYVSTAARFTPGGIVTGAVAAWLLTEGIAYVSGQWQLDQSFAGNTYCGGLFNGVTTACYPTPSARAQAWANSLVAANYNLNPQYYGPVTALVTSPGVLNSAGDGFTSLPVIHVKVLNKPSGTVYDEFDQGLATTVVVNTSAPGAAFVPATDTDWAKFDTKPVPDQVANDTPVPLPVGLPSLNPDSTGLPHPVTVPTGDPVPVPETAPQQYKQPVTDIVPSPTQTEPWRVDQRPREVVGIDPTGLPEPTGTSAQPGAAQEIDIETCGLPGKPKCLIDEQDTPSPDAATNDVSVKARIQESQKPLDDLIADPFSVVPALPTLHWDFALPTGCTALLTPAFAPFMTQIDVCQFQPIFHDIMSLVWVLGGLFGAISTFWRSTFSA